VRIAEDGPDCYGKAGSLEGYASGTGIARLAHSLFPRRWPLPPDMIQLAVAARSGDADALHVFATASRYFGRGLAMIVDTLNPERIVLGGLGMRLMDILVEPALRIYKEEALPQAASVCSIVPAALGESIGDIASLCAAFDQGQLLRDHDHESCSHIPLKHAAPDGEEFIRLLMHGHPGHRVPLVEYIVDDVVMQPVVEQLLQRAWVPPGPGGAPCTGYLDNMIAFWSGMGYDFVRFELSLPFPERKTSFPMRHREA